MLLALSPVSTAQDIDSLEAALERANGSDRAEILAALTELSYRSNPRRAIRFGNEGLALLAESGDLQLESEIRYWKGRAHFGIAEYDSAIVQAELLRASARERSDSNDLARAANLHATALALQGRFTEAVELFEEALSLWKDSGDREGVANALNNLGIGYMRLGDYDVSLEYYIRALEVWDELDDEVGTVRTLNNAGNVHYELGNIDEALSFYERVLAYREATGDQRGQAIVLNNLGLIYHDQGRFEEALEAYERGERMVRAIEDWSNLARILGNQGKTHAAIGEHETALRKEERALELRREIGDRRGVGITESTIGRIHQSIGNIELALVHFDAALAAAVDVSDVKLMEEVYEAKAELYVELGDYESAFRAHRLFKAMHDSLFTAESQKTIAELQARYETEQKEREIEALQHERELSILWRNILIAGIALLTLMAFLIYSRYRIRTKAHRQLEAAHSELKTTQAQLVQSEKAASLGRLTAGIAHEMKNPLNFVNNFAALSVDLANEIKAELSSRDPDGEEIQALVDDLVGNARRIAVQGRRADDIVSNMMLHASGSRGQKEPNNLNTLVADYVGIAYYGMQARDPGFECAIHKELDQHVPLVEVDPQEIGRVLANILYNAFEATEEQRASGDPNYEPELRVSTRVVGDEAEIRIWDNGIGLPEGDVSQVFDPFFTTKPTGTGTGLGLSLSHDIVVGIHGGSLRANRKDGGTEFLIRLPLA